MSALPDESLLTVFGAALDQLGAVPLAATPEAILVGYEELELGIPWPALHGCLRGPHPARWVEAMAELVLSQAAVERAEESDWEHVGATVLPVLWGCDGAAALATRAPGVLAFTQPDGLILSVAHPLPSGRRLVLRRDLEAFGVPHSAVLAAALANLRHATANGAVLTLADGPEGLLFALVTGDGLESARLPMLAELLPQWADCGFVAALPARDLLRFVPFNHRGCLQLPELVTLVHEGYGTLPFALSHDLHYIGPAGSLALGLDAGPGHAPRLSFPTELIAEQARLAASGAW